MCSSGIAQLLNFDISKKWDICKEALEKESFYYILKNLILPLSKTIVVEPKYYEKFSLDNSIKHEFEQVRKDPLVTSALPITEEPPLREPSVVLHVH